MFPIERQQLNSKFHHKPLFFAKMSTQLIKFYNFNAPKNEKLSFIY